MFKVSELTYPAASNPNRREAESRPIGVKEFVSWTLKIRKQHKKMKRPEIHRRIPSIFRPAERKKYHLA